MPKELDFVNLRLCIEKYEAERLYIRDCGGFEDGKYRVKGKTKVNENLEGRTLDFRKDDNGLFMLVDSKEVFHFPLQDYDKGFSLAYERVEETDDGIGRMVVLSQGIDPYDPKLPEPRMSSLRQLLDSHLMEIYFKGRIDIEFHSWWEEPHWKYWKVV